MGKAQSKQVPFHGILAVGSTKDEAVNRYRLLALGKGVAAFADQAKNISFVTSSDNSLMELFNPTTGDLDLEENTSLASSLVFEAKAGDVEATHYICESGCGTHLVYDSEELVKFCPVCTSAVVESGEDVDEGEDDGADLNLDDEEDDGEESESSDADDAEEDGDDAEEDDAEEDDAEEDDAEEDDAEEDDAEEDDAEEDGDDADDGTTGAPLVLASSARAGARAPFQKHSTARAAGGASVSSEVTPIIIKAKTLAEAKTLMAEAFNAVTASAGGDEQEVEVEHKVCVNLECGTHVLSTSSADISECPECKSALGEPVVASDGDDDDDDADGDDDDDGDDADGDDEDGDDMSLKPTDVDGDDAEKSEESKSPAAVVDPATLMDVDALAQIDDSGEDAHKSLDLSYSSSIAGKPMWTAYFEGKPVATATEDLAGKNADIFTEGSFGHAVLASARHVGVRNILRDMGFRGITNRVAIAPLVKAEVGKEIAVARSELDRDRKEYSERLLAAMATAAIGINRGFFSDVKNPLKEKLWDALSAAGIKNPETLIHNAFRTSSDSYHSTLFAKATEIIAKPLEVQESLAKAVIGTNYLVSESSSAESGDSGSEMENRVGQLGTVTAASGTATVGVKNSEAQAGMSTKIAAVVSSLGRRR